MRGYKIRSLSTGRSNSDGRDGSLRPSAFPAAFRRVIEKPAESTLTKDRTGKVVAYLRSSPVCDIASRRQFHYTYRPVGKHNAHRFSFAQTQIVIHRRGRRLRLRDNGV